MNILMLLAHPDPASFNHAIADTACARIEENGHRLIFHDLYRERFDPVLPAGEIPADAELPSRIDAHCRELMDADGIVVIHPNWWGQPPAVLKGWWTVWSGRRSLTGLLKAMGEKVFPSACSRPAQR